MVLLLPVSLTSYFYLRRHTDRTAKKASNKVCVCCVCCVRWCRKNETNYYRKLSTNTPPPHTTPLVTLTRSQLRGGKYVPSRRVSKQKKKHRTKTYSFIPIGISFVKKRLAQGERKHPAHIPRNLWTTTGGTEVAEEENTQTGWWYECFTLPENANCQIRLKASEL